MEKKSFQKLSEEEQQKYWDRVHAELQEAHRKIIAKHQDDFDDLGITVYYRANLFNPDTCVIY